MGTGYKQILPFLDHFVCLLDGRSFHLGELRIQPIPAYLLYHPLFN